MRGNAVIHFLKVNSGLEKPQTQTSATEREALALYSRKARIAVEIGVFEGVNTVLIASNMAEDGILYGIDPFFKGKLGISYEKIITRTQLKRSGTQKKVVLIEKLSAEATMLVPDGIDFIFIDGDHSWHGIQRDWEDWPKKVKKNGIIALHDTSILPDSSNKHLDSINFFNKIIKPDPSFKLLFTVDSLNVLQKLK